MEQKLEFTIVVNSNTKISVDQYFDEGVWLHLMTSSGTMYTTMTIDQAKQMIDALTQIVEAA